MPVKRYVPVFERIWVISSIPECERILDLGCGEGIYAVYLQRKAQVVVGVDLSLHCLRTAKQAYKDLILADASRLPFRSGTFSAVWASEVIEHISSLTVFEEIERVTQSHVIATIPNPRGPFYRLDPSHVLRYDLHSLRTFLSRRSWKYTVHGLGLCLPIRSMPSIFSRALIMLSWRSPGFSFNFLIVGKHEIR